MATTIQNVRRSFTATATISQYALTSLSEGDAALATVTDDGLHIGFADRAANPGDSLGVVLINGGGTSYAICAVTVSEDDILYGAPSGKVSTVTTDAGDAVGIALQDGAPDAVIEILLA